ncbi:hypothetical protein HYS95_00210 [Candidatus Daviesbacteria bacterium]|nr:hypothetical protein [Candidatus Daviesbacteria bacterium]
MKSIKGKALRVKFIITGFFLLLYALRFPLYPLYAAESSPSADIKSKLEEFKKEAASKAAQLKELISKKLQNKAYIGRVKSKSDNSVTLAAITGPKIISLNQDTVFASQIKTKQKLTINQEDQVVALGDIDETGVLIAKKIILIPTIDYELKTYLWGQVVLFEDKLATIRDKSNKNISAALPKEAKVKAGDFVILTGSKNKNEIFEAVFVYVIPYDGILKPKKIATPSAKISTPSASPRR